MEIRSAGPIENFTPSTTPCSPRERRHVVSHDGSHAAGTPNDLRPSQFRVPSSHSMRHRLSLILTLAAWLLASGSHWDLVQTFAWGRMIATSAQSMPLLSAVQKTFTPEAACELCHAVADAKREAPNDLPAPGTKSPGKVLLLCAPSALFSYSPPMSCVGVADAVREPRSAGRAAPPLPPPRAVA